MAASPHPPVSTCTGQAAGARRCRSVSPPVKRKPFNELTDLQVSKHRTIDGIIPNIRHCGKLVESTKRGLSNPAILQSSDDKHLAQHVTPVHIPLAIQEPIIKQVGNSYLVKQPKPRRNTMVTAKSRMLNYHHRKSISISSVLDKIGTSDVEVTESKVRRTKPCHPRSSSVPLTPFFDFRVKDVQAYKELEQSCLFDYLPEECMLKIFSYLPQISRGRCMRVCHLWYYLIQQPQLWRDINFCEFSLCQGHGCTSVVSSTGGFVQCDHQCYRRYVRRIENYTSFLIDVKPKPKRLMFAFDLIEDNWLATVQRFMLYIDLTGLESAYLNWRETPVKPYWLEEKQQLNDLMYKNRRRQRKFMNMFEVFTQEAPNVTSLVVPFDWSNRSTQYLLSLKKLRDLTIEKDFALQKFCQENLTALSRIRTLERLVLEVWPPTCAGMEQYSITSKSLRYLDIRQCRGFYLSAVDLPSLQVLLTDRKPWNNRAACHQLQQIKFPCIRDVLHEGTNNLAQLNHVIIHGQLFTEDVNEVLEKVCACAQHKVSL